MVKAGKQWKFVSTIQNKGNGSSSGGTISWYLSRDKVWNVKSDRRIGTTQVGGVLANARQESTLILNPKSTKNIAAGKYWLFAVVSKEQNTSKLAQKNNVKVSSRQVTVKR